MGRRALVKIAAGVAIAASLALSTMGTASAAGAAAVAPPAASAEANRGGGGGGGGVTPNAQFPKGMEAIRVDEAKFRLVATQRGTGQQVYHNCVNDKYTLREPVAVLSALRGGPVGIHGQGPFWASSDDGSRVNGSAPVAVPSPAGPSNIPWLKVTGTPVGPDGVFGKVTIIQRTDTRGGAAPTKCGAPVVAVSYSTIYQFWVPR